MLAESAEMIDSLQAIYAELPNLECQGKCQEACGPILMSDTEEQVMRSAGKTVPDPIEVLQSTHTNCPHLTPFGRCSVYEIRPLICRIWGSVKSMKCEWGCIPDEWLTDTQARSLLQRADALAGSTP